MIAPVSDGPQQNTGGLLCLWDEVTIGELPLWVQDFLMSRAEIKSLEILQAIVQPASVNDACSSFIETTRSFMTSEFDERTAEIAVRRSGLVTDAVPTLEEMGQMLGLTRERVRQIETRSEGVTKATSDRRGSHSRSPLDVRFNSYLTVQTRGIGERFARLITRHPLAHTLRAWFDLNNGRPLTHAEINELTQTKHYARCVLRVLDILDYPRALIGATDFWFRSEGDKRACQVMYESTRTWEGARDWGHLAARIKDNLPKIDHQLDVAATVQRVGEACGFGPGPNGQIISGHGRLVRRIARKTVTYLIARATPVPEDELANIISMGQFPFEVFLRPSVSVAWLQCNPPQFRTSHK